MKAAFVWTSRAFRRRVAFLAVIAPICFSIVYVDVQTYDPATASSVGLSDTKIYLAMFSGEPVTGIGSYRPLVPLLARLVPPVPSALFDPGHLGGPDRGTAYRFAVVNLLFLLAACVVLFLIQENLGLADGYCFLGVLLFLGSQTVARTAGLPIADTAFFFFFLLCLAAIQRDSFWLLLVAAAVGVAAKELVLLSIPLILLSTYPWRRRLVLLGATVPAIVVYTAIRLFYAPTAVDAYVSGQTVAFFGSMLRSLSSLAGLKDVALAFGVCWVLAGYALLKCEVPTLLKRWAWLVPIVFVGVLLGGGNWGRSMFTAFPVMVSLAAFGLAGWVARASSEITTPPS